MVSLTSCASSHATLHLSLVSIRLSTILLNHIVSSPTCPSCHRCSFLTWLWWLWRCCPQLDLKELELAYQSQANAIASENAFLEYDLAVTSPSLALAPHGPADLYPHPHPRGQELLDQQPARQQSPQLLASLQSPRFAPPGEQQQQQRRRGLPEPDMSPGDEDDRRGLRRLAPLQSPEAQQQGKAGKQHQQYDVTAEAAYGQLMELQLRQRSFMTDRSKLRLQLARLQQDQHMLHQQQQQQQPQRKEGSRTPPQPQPPAVALEESMYLPYVDEFTDVRHRLSRRQEEYDNFDGLFS
jgi:hypothetical protein